MVNSEAPGPRFFVSELSGGPCGAVQSRPSPASTKRQASKRKVKNMRGTRSRRYAFTDRLYLHPIAYGGWVKVENGSESARDGPHPGTTLRVAPAPRSAGEGPGVRAPAPTRNRFRPSPSRHRRLGENTSGQPEAKTIQRWNWHAAQPRDPDLALRRLALRRGQRYVRFRSSRFPVFGFSSVVPLRSPRPPRCDFVSHAGRASGKRRAAGGGSALRFARSCASLAGAKLTGMLPGTLPRRRPRLI